MERYSINIIFKTGMFERDNNIIEQVKTLKEAMGYKNLIDETVIRAFIKDNANGKIISLKDK